MSLLLSASAHGDQFNVFANATTFWDTLTVRTDPGVSITWLGTSNLTSCGQNLDGTVGVGGQSIPNWNPVSLSTQIGGLAAFGEATTQNLSSTLDWTAYPPAGTSEMGCLRQGNFLVTGSGNVTFTIDYSLAANRLVNASSLPYCAWRIVISQATRACHNVTSPRCTLFISKALLILARHSPTTRIGEHPEPGRKV